MKTSKAGNFKGLEVPLDNDFQAARRNNNNLRRDE